jgi:hypothetical protein
MTKTRLEYVQRKTAESGQSGTVTYDLPESGVIPEIQLVAYSTPTASTDPALPLSEALTKIEIVDGGETIVSATANDLKGLAMLNKYHSLSSPEINDNAVEGRDVIPILLGGTVNGKEFAPDFARFDNPQLKISWDYSLTTGLRGADYDADTTPVMKFTVLAHIATGGNKYAPGFMRTQETYQFTQAASASEEIRIPRGESLYQIGVRAGYDAKDLTDDLNVVELNLNHGEDVPLRLYADEVVSSQALWYGKPFEYSFAMDLVDAVEIDTHMGWLDDFSAFSMSSAGRSIEYDSMHKGVEAVGFMDVASPTAISAYEQVGIKTTGYAPFGVWGLPMNTVGEMENDLLDTTQFRDIKLKLTSGASASTSCKPAILTQYAVPM